jgi:hypothetical protein
MGAPSKEIGEISSDGGDAITVHLELDGEELLALLSYIALGLNFSATYSGEGGFLSPHEIGLHLGYINADGAARLTMKLATAVAAFEEERQHTVES